MRKKSTVIGIICAVVCAVCVGAFMQSVQSAADDSRAEALARYGGEQLEVCVATRDIAAGESLEASALETKLWVADLLPQGAVQDASEVVGKQVTSSILQGEVISTQRFEENAVSLEVPMGYVAVSVPSEDVQAVGGAVSAGSHVDLYATGNTDTTLIGQNVLVLATSVSATESAGASSSSVTWVTVAIEPESVQEVVSAAQGMQLYFALPGESLIDDSSSVSEMSSQTTREELFQTASALLSQEVFDFPEASSGQSRQGIASANEKEESL